MHSTISPNMVRAIDWACRVAADSRSLFLDTETTGLGRNAEIVDIAVVNGDGHTVLDTLVKPAGPIPADATNIHGITDAMVGSAPAWPEVAAQIRELLTNASNVVIYNADFDVRIMDQCNILARQPRYRANWQCAMQQYAAFAGQRHQRYGGYRWHKLTDAAAAFGYREAVQHRALEDTRMCRAVVFGMAAI